MQIYVIHNGGYVLDVETSQLKFYEIKYDD